MPQTATTTQFATHAAGRATSPMSDLKARISDRQAPSRFEHGFIKQPRQPSESGTHPQAPTTAPKSLLSRIGPVSPMSGTAARHESPPPTSSHFDSCERSTPTSARPNLPYTQETKWRMSPTSVSLTSNVSVEGVTGRSVEVSDIRSDNSPSNNGHLATLPTNGAAEHAYVSKASDRKFVISSTASTPRGHSSESGIVLDMLHLTPVASMPSVPPEAANEIQSAPDIAQLPLLREALLPAIMKNAQCRPNFGNIDKPEKIRDKLREVLNDEFCDSLVEKMQAIQHQMQTIRSEEARSVTEHQPVTALTNTAGLVDLTQGSHFPPLQGSTATSIASKSCYEVGGSSIPTPPVSAPLSEPPRAPRAMRLLEKQIQGLSMISPGSSTVLDQPRSRSRSKDISRGRRGQSKGPNDPATGSSIRSRSSTRTHQDSNPQPFGISIPMDPSFFAAPPASVNVQQNEFSSPSKRNRSVSRPPRSPVRRRSTGRSRNDGGRLSPAYRSPSATRRHSASRLSRWTVVHRQTTRSPSLRRRRSPSVHPLSSRRYRSRSRPARSPLRRPSPLAKRRRLSFSTPRSPPRTKRSISRSRRSLSRRPLSPPFRRRTPVHLRTITREHRSPSPLRRTSPSTRLHSPPRRGRQSTPSRSRPPPHHRRRSPPLHPTPQNLVRCSPSPRPTPAQQCLLPSPSTPYGPTPLPRPYRHRLSPDEDHPQLIQLNSILHPPSLPLPSPPLRQSTSTHPDDLCTLTPVLNHERTQPPSPADIVTIKREPDNEDLTPALHSPPSPASKVPPDPPLPCHSVPGLWLVKMGHDQANVLISEFEVDSETAKKWDLTSLSAPGNTAARLSLQLRCLPKDLVQTVYKTILPSATAGDVAVALSEIKTEWPPQGSLIVQMNPAERCGRSWLPSHMAPSSPALDVTDSIRQGLNVVRLIQLTDMADKIFVLQATPSLTSERDLATDLPTYWDIAAFDLPQGLISSCRIPSVTIEVT